MKTSFKSGFGFGLTSGVITTLGLLVGLSAGTSSQSIVIAGILTIAIADAFSDSLGMHVSQEAESHHTSKEIWQSTLATFISKLIVASTFIFPILLFNLQLATIVSVVWGLLLLGIFSYYVAQDNQIKPWKVILEHLLIAILVVVIANYVGLKISQVIR